MVSAQELLKAALALSPDERAALTERLAASLAPAGDLDPEEWETAWRSEVDRRLAAVDSGAAALIPDEQVWAEVEELLGSTSG